MKRETDRYREKGAKNSLLLNFGECSLNFALILGTQNVILHY